MQSQPKPQFATWLIEQVETRQYAGLCFVGPNQFRVPWKHNSRRDCNDEDIKIFRAWAIASGKIKEFPNDKARWKTNFRCALNNLSGRFSMVKDCSKLSEDPHKIYEIINTVSTHKYEGQSIEESLEDSNMEPDIYSSPVQYYPEGNEQNLLNGFMALDLGNNPGWPENYIQENPAAQGGVSATAPAENPLLPSQMPYCGENTGYVQTQMPTINDLEISIHYRKKEMLKTLVNTQRLQLHFCHEDPELNAQHLCFPTTEALLDHKQVDYTNRILNNIQRGLLLEVRENGIYALRQDKCHVFACTGDHSVAHPDPKKLPQNTWVELLSFEKYVNELTEFKRNNAGSPHYTINMCFGEKFPDGKPLEKKLIVVQVVPRICRYFHEMAQMEGASSLQSTNISLQISHNSLYDLINSVFSLPMVEEPVRAVEPFLNQM